MAAPTSEPGDLISLVPKHAPALEAARRAAAAFDVPFAAEVSVVERDPHGLSVQEQRRAVGQALAIDRPAGGGDPPFLVLPWTNTAGAMPGSRESSTAVISYFEFPPAMPLAGRMQAVDRYMADARGNGAPVVGRTGILPAQLHEGTIVEDALPYVEAATILMVALVVGLKFRSLGAPALTLATVGIAYLMALRATERLSEATGLAVPDILKPLMVALVLGIVTDYTIFYATTMRPLVVDGMARVPAAREATAQITPIVVAGGAILAASLASLQVAQLSFFRAVGPGLAVVGARRPGRIGHARPGGDGGLRAGALLAEPRGCEGRPGRDGGAGICGRGSRTSRHGGRSASSSRRRAWPPSWPPRGSSRA